MNIVLLSITILLTLFSGFLLKCIADNRTNIKCTKKFFREHGIDERYSEE
jgi:hypothetical protein